MAEPRHNKGFWSKGFTLAEVLITLGIIGVVAALTIPTLVKSYRKKITETRVRLAYSQFVQAIQMSQVYNGPISSWNFPQPETTEKSREFFNTYFKPYIKAEECKENTQEACGKSVGSFNYQYTLSNSSSLAFQPGINGIAIMIDINGPEGPNVTGIDAFYFSARKDYDYKFMPAGWTPTVTKEDILAGTYVYNNEPCMCQDVDTNSEIFDFQQTRCCALLLYLDNFKITEDYPISYYK